MIEAIAIRETNIRDTRVPEPAPLNIESALEITKEASEKEISPDKNLDRTHEDKIKIVNPNRKSKGGLELPLSEDPKK